MKYLALFIVSVAALTLSSCDSSTTTVHEHKNYLPSAKGSYWIYDRYTIDKTTGVTTGVRHSDSAYVADSIPSFHGRGAIPLVYVQMDSASQDTTYWSKGSDGSVYTYINIPLDSVKVYAPTLIIPDLWAMVVPADGATSWTVLDTKVDSVPFKYLTFDLVLDVKLTIKGTKGVSKSVVIDGTTYTAQEYIVTFDANGFLGTVSAVTFSAPQHFWFIEEVGIYQSLSDNSKILASSSPIAEFDGTQSTLTKFFVKK